jgi:hypothetical protein
MLREEAGRLSGCPFRPERRDRTDSLEAGPSNGPNTPAQHQNLEHFLFIPTLLKQKCNLLGYTSQAIARQRWGGVILGCYKLNETYSNFIKDCRVFQLIYG